VEALSSTKVRYRAGSPAAVGCCAPWHVLAERQVVTTGRLQHCSGSQYDCAPATSAAIPIVTTWCLQSRLDQSKAQVKLLTEQLQQVCFVLLV
jgi:hypothetical protein